MLAEHYPDLENFMTTWFNDAYDFDELDSILDRMIKLDATDNLICLSREIKRLESEEISLLEVNEFFKRIGVRQLTGKRYADFKRKIIWSAARVHSGFN